MTRNSDFKVTPLFDADSPGNSTRDTAAMEYLQELTHVLLRVSFRMILSDLEFLSDIFNDTRGLSVTAELLVRAVCSRVLVNFETPCRIS